MTDGWFRLVKKGKKNRFGNAKCSSSKSPHVTVHGLVEEVDTQGQLGFPKTHGELWEIKEFADREV